MGGGRGEGGREEGGGLCETQKRHQVVVGSVAGGGVTVGSVAGGGVTVGSVTGGSVAGGGVTGGSVAGGGVTVGSVAGGGVTVGSVAGGGVTVGSVTGGSVAGGGVTGGSVAGGGVAGGVGDLDLVLQELCEVLSSVDEQLNVEGGVGPLGDGVLASCRIHVYIMCREYHSQSCSHAVMQSCSHTHLFLLWDMQIPHNYYYVSSDILYVHVCALLPRNCPNLTPPHYIY